MRTDELITLLALRYRLIWAHVRSRTGRIVLLVTGYLVAAFLALVFALGGVGAAAASIRVGRGELVAQLLLAGIYVNASLGAVFLGIGVTPVFADSALRRYPLSRTDRLLARHATALLEPLWLVVLALALGLAIGFCVSGLVSPWLALPAAGIFVVTTYLFACVLVRLGAWILSIPAGALVIIVVGSGLMMMVPFAPALLARIAARGGSVPGLAFLELTPPFAAARAIATTAAQSASAGLLLVIIWCIVLWVIVSAVQRLPVRSRTIAGASVVWDHPCDRIALLFGARMAPLAGKILRYYVRSPVRYNYFFALPAVALLAHSEPREGAFLFALGAAPAVGFASTIPISMNLFGFDGQGLRRYFLIPIHAAGVFRTVAMVSLIPGTILVLIGLAAWLIFSPIHTDLRMATMLLCSGFAGLLFLHALGLWTTLLAPRTIPFGVAFGNKLSLAANLLMLVAMGILFGLPWALTRAGFETVVGAWWVTALLLAGAALFFLATLKAGAAVFAARRERIIALVEERA